MSESLRDSLIRCGWASSFSAGTLVRLIEKHYAEHEVMLDQAMQAPETLRDYWLERTGLTIQDDPFVEDACSAIQSIRSERLQRPTSS